MIVKVLHASDSREQQQAENSIRALLVKVVGCPLAEETMSLGNGVMVKIDGVNHQHRVLCEIYSRVGKLKGSQPDKLASDVLKLLTVERVLGGKWRKVICFADSQAAKCVQGKSWLALATRQAEFDVVVVELSDSERNIILAAQNRQIMVNSSVPES